MKNRQKRNKDRGAFAKRLETLAAKLGGLSRLAEKAGVNVSSLSRYVAGGTFPNLPSAAAIAQAGSVSLDWLGTGRGSADFSSMVEENVPFFDLQASAGPGLLAMNPQPSAQTIALPLAQIRRQTGVVAPDLCALLAEGDSMEPTIRSGALLILDRAAAQPREGVYVLMRGDDVLVKRIQPRGPQCLRLMSDNPRYAPEDVAVDDASSPVRIFGRVVWIGQAI